MIAALLLAAFAAQAPMVEDFSRGMDDWWAEGGERVWVEDGRLHVKADNTKIPGGGAATVWWKRPHPANFVLEIDAHVISSSFGGNNVNMFFSYRDPSGRPLFETRASRASADYGHYHKLDGYIITFLRDVASLGGRHPDGSTKARIRVRRNPGFHLLKEYFGGHCEAGRTYHLTVTRRGKTISFAVDGEVMATVDDPNPLPGGLFGLRTFRTYLWWDNISLKPLD